MLLGCVGDSSIATVSKGSEFFVLELRFLPGKIAALRGKVLGLAAGHEQAAQDSFILGLKR